MLWFFRRKFFSFAVTDSKWCCCITSAKPSTQYIFGLFLGSFNKYNSCKNNWTSLWECQRKNTVLSPSWTLVICSVATRFSLYRSFCFWVSPGSVAAFLPRPLTALTVMQASSVASRCTTSRGWSQWFCVWLCLFSVQIAYSPSLIFRALPCAYTSAVILFPKEHTSKKSTKDLKEGWRLLTSSSSPFHYTWASGQSTMFAGVLDCGLISQIMLAFQWPEGYPCPIMSWLILCLGCA